MSGSRDWLRSAAATWDDRADWWDEMSTANAASADRQAELDRWQEAMSIAPGSQLLDAGCGTGQFAIAWAQRGCHVTGVDLSSAMLERARANAARQDVEIDFHLAPIDALPVSDGFLDAVFCRTVLHLVPDVSAALGEFRRVLRPGGRIYVSVPGALSPIYSNAWRRHIDPGDRPINYMVPWELESVLTELGWTILDGWGDWSLRQPDVENSQLAELADATDPRLLQATATTWGFVAT